MIVRPGHRRAGIAEGVGDRIAPVAAEILQRDLHARCGLAPFVFGKVQHTVDLHHGFLVETRGNDRCNRLFELDQAIQDLIQHVVRRQRVLVLLVFAQFRRRRTRQDALGNDDAVRTQGAFRLPAIAQMRQPVNLRLVEVLDRVEAAIHVAIERGVADRHLRLVAGGHHHHAEFVGDRHEQRATCARLQVFFRDVARPAFEQRLERCFHTVDSGEDRHHLVFDAKRLCGGCSVIQRLLRREAVRQHHALHALGTERIDGNGGADGGIDAT